MWSCPSTQLKIEELAPPVRNGRNLRPLRPSQLHREHLFPDIRAFGGHLPPSPGRDQVRVHESPHVAASHQLPRHIDGHHFPRPLASGPQLAACSLQGSFPAAVPDGAGTVGEDWALLGAGGEVLDGAQ